MQKTFIRQRATTFTRHFTFKK